MEKKFYDCIFFLLRYIGKTKNRFVRLVVTLLYNFIKIFSARHIELINNMFTY